MELSAAVCQTMPSACLERLMTMWLKKRLPGLHLDSLSNPEEYSARTRDAKWMCWTLWGLNSGIIY